MSKSFQNNLELLAVDDRRTQGSSITLHAMLVTRFGEPITGGIAFIFSRQGNNYLPAIATGMFITGERSGKLEQVKPRTDEREGGA